MVAVALLFVAAIQGDSTPRDSAPGSRTTVLPVLSYSEVTGVQYGGTMFRGFRVGADTGTRPSSLSVYAVGTAKGYAKVYVQFDRWSADNTTRSRARLEYISYPLPFYGIGRSTHEDAEEWYSSGVTTAQFFVDRTWRRSLFLHGELRYTRSRPRETDDAGLLRQGSIAGAMGSDILATAVGLVIDTRNDVAAPTGGSYARIIPSLSTTSLVSDLGFRRLTIDARRYASLGAHVAAVQVQYDGLDGTAPFDLMPMIGADTAMRGYPRGRFRDQHAFTTQAELRLAHWRRFGGVLFAGLGTVAPRFSKLVSGAWFPSYGAGARYVLSPKYRTILRADLAFGRGSFGVNVGVGEAF